VMGMKYINIAFIRSLYSCALAVSMRIPLRTHNRDGENNLDIIDQVVDRAEARAVHFTLSDEDREHVFCAYYDEEYLSKEETERLLGSNELKTAEENAQGAKRLFEGDTSRFLE
jgi:hypothetical protein